MENKHGIGLTTVYLVGVRLSVPVNVMYAVHGEDDCGLHPPAEGAASNALPEAYRHYNDGHFRDFVALFRQLCCDSVRLICGTIDVFINAMPDRLMRKLLLRIPAALLMVYDKDLECAMWDMLELGLPRVDDAQLVTLSEFLVWVAAGKNASSAAGLAWDRTVCKVLCAAQSPDPRPQSHYPGRKWCVEGLQDLQLDKLSRITLRFLILLANSAGE
ncbi:uncharacterized protein LOC129595803 [Paramacrobiotus metropolitanus]|uniref:uncharacterized protein LOC129595803 n=1 Tax=Paramacrobiotus metropolitanus TaxID=2943436 RepID=UPI0024460062|nr:uncharacterized protein LOC129595803 [Paramacrobiotus metropolitanus]